MVVRNTFEGNPGLCELFKRKIMDRAESAGLRRDMIDFESQIDMKGTFQDNLRTFYREYPQLAQDSDYLRLKSPRPLSGIVLEETWRSYERHNGRKRQSLAAARWNFPDLSVSYTVGFTPLPSQEETESNQDAKKPIDARAEANPRLSTHPELMRLLLDRVASVAGENATRTILHQIGREIGLNAFHHSRNAAPAGNLVAALDHALRVRGLGRVADLKEIDRHSSITYVCSIEDCSLCRKGIAANSTCSVLRGMVTRWFESHLQKKAETTEGSCVDGEPHLCVFRVTFRK
jgi:predicted hydrocarbon binding protein